MFLAEQVEPFRGFFGEADDSVYGLRCAVCSLFDLVLQFSGRGLWFWVTMW